MPAKTGESIFRNHSLAVIGNTDQLSAAFFDIHCDSRCAGVEGILHQLLHDGRGPLDDLSCRNPVRDIVRKGFDLRHTSQFQDLRIWIPISFSCWSDTGDGEPLIISTARAVFGNAMTSRIDDW